MIEHDLVERASARFDPPSDGFERFSRRRERKQRNQRMGTIALAVLIMVALVGAFLGSYTRSEQPATGGITPQSAGELRLQWSADLDADTPPSDSAKPDQPAVGDGKVFVGTMSGTFFAFPASCGTGGASCEPAWTTHLSGTIDHTATVADGLVFVSTTRGRLYAFPTDCSATCAPRWTAEVGKQIYSSPVVADGMVYGIDLWNGTLYAFEERCSARCRPAWTADLGARLDSNLDCAAVWQCVTGAPTVASGLVLASPEGRPDEPQEAPLLQAFDARTGAKVWGSVGVDTSSPERYRWPVVDGDRVFISSDEQLYAFPLHCAALCHPLWRFSTNGEFVGQQVVADGFVYVGIGTVGEHGGVFAFPEDCRRDGGLCRPAWSQASFAPNPALDHVVVGGGVVVSTSGEEPEGEIQAYMTRCAADGGTCRPAWTTATLGREVPTVSGELVYVKDANGELFAFPLGCSGECAPVWRSGDQRGLSSATVTADGVYATQSWGRLVAFGLGGPDPEPGGANTGVAVFYAIAAMGAVGLALAARRRRRRLGDL
jgi:MYXO-CTERM domain-containing protein